MQQQRFNDEESQQDNEITGDFKGYFSEARMGFSSFFLLLGLVVLSYSFTFKPKNAPLTLDTVSNEFRNVYQNRFPDSYKKISVDLFSDMRVQQAFVSAELKFGKKKVNQCRGPQSNIDVYIDEQSVSSLVGHNVFSLDCRESSGNSMISFLIVMNMYGDILAVHSPEKRAESVSVMNPETIIYSTVQTGEAFLWEWKEDTHEKLPFLADSHSLIHVYNENIFYGFQAMAEGGSPNIVIGWNGTDGSEIFRFELPLQLGSSFHCNYLSVSGDFLFISIRDLSSILKINRRTQEMVWTLGGDRSNFNIIPHQDDEKKNAAHSENNFHFWMNQHKFQIIGDEGDHKTFTLFNNNYEKNSASPASSRMMKLDVLETDMIAEISFTFDTLDTSMIYGGADILPFDNMLGNSYPEMIISSDLDKQYHANIWEITNKGQVAWRVGFKGLNPSLQETDSGRYVKVQKAKNLPTGWNIFMVERFYSSPLLGNVCIEDHSTSSLMLRLDTYNTIRSQVDHAGYTKLYADSSGGNILIDTAEFIYKRAFGKSFATVLIPKELYTSKLHVEIDSQWQETSTFVIPEDLSSLPLC